MMILKIADKQDLCAILNLQYLAYQSEAMLCNNPKIPPLTQTLQEVELEFIKGIFLKALNEKEELVGSVRAYSESGTLYIGKLIVRPDLQGQGIGTILLKDMEERFPHKRYELFTSSKSVRNIKLYERLGYLVFKEQEITVSAPDKCPGIAQFA